MLSAIRSALHLLWMVISVIPWSLVVLAGSFFTDGKGTYWLCQKWLANVVHSLKALCGVQWRVHGLENLPQKGDNTPTILVCNHQSTFETFLIPTVMPRDLAYVFKKELLKVPFFGWAMGRMDMIHIDRSKGSEALTKMATQGERLMNNGTWVVIFPEGTRQPYGKLGNFKTGGTRLALATNAQIIPIAVNTAKHWPRKGFVKTPGTVDMVIGSPMQADSRSADAWMKDIKEWIAHTTMSFDTSQTLED